MINVAALLARLRDHGATVAVAESLTGGLVTGALTEVAGASAVVRGGLVVYATDLKAELAGVDAELLASRGPVDPQVAGQLAHGVRSRLGATFGLGVTGVAGPDPQNGVAVGTVYVGIAGPTGERVVTHELTGDRARIRAQSVVEALRLLDGESRALVER